MSFCSGYSPRRVLGIFPLCRETVDEKQQFTQSSSAGTHCMHSHMNSHLVSPIERCKSPYAMMFLNMLETRGKIPCGNLADALFTTFQTMV